MQFIVIYGIRFVCGGHRGLEGVRPPARKDAHLRSSPILASLPLPGPLALWLMAPALMKLMPPRSTHPTTCPQLPTLTEGLELRLSPATS